MSKPAYVIDLGGSIVNGGTLNAAFLMEFKALLCDYVVKGATFYIIVGGGAIARAYQDFSREQLNADNHDLDWLGIRATRINAELVRVVCKEWSYGKVLKSPDADIKESEAGVFVFAGWKPGWSTDYVSVLVAKRCGIKEVLSLSNIKGVYEVKDGRVKEGALIPQLSWEEYETIVGSEWTPGMRIPFDPVATKEAKAQGIKVVILDGENISNVRKFFDRQAFVGTVIS